jgi:membrane protein YdbS with pleckstrin-like domain
MQDSRKEKQRKAEPPPVKTEEELHRQAIEDEIILLRDRNIPFSIVKAFFLLLLFAFGIALLIEGNYLLGAAWSALWLLASVWRVLLTLRYVRQLKELRNMQSEFSDAPD